MKNIYVFPSAYIRNSSFNITWIIIRFIKYSEYFILPSGQQIISLNLFTPPNDLGSKAIFERKCYIV